MWGKFTVFDIALAIYFFFTFEPKWIGYLLVLFIMYRVVLDIIPPDDITVLDYRKTKQKNNP